MRPVLGLNNDILPVRMRMVIYTEWMSECETFIMWEYNPLYKFQHEKSRRCLLECVYWLRRLQRSFNIGMILAKFYFKDFENLKTRLRRSHACNSPLFQCSPVNFFSAFTSRRHCAPYMRADQNSWGVYRRESCSWMGSTRIQNSGSKFVRPSWNDSVPWSEMYGVYREGGEGDDLGHGRIHLILTLQVLLNRLAPKAFVSSLLGKNCRSWNWAAWVLMSEHTSNGGRASDSRELTLEQSIEQRVCHLSHAMSMPSVTGHTLYCMLCRHS